MQAESQGQETRVPVHDWDPVEELMDWSFIVVVAAVTALVVVLVVRHRTAARRQRRAEKRARRKVYKEWLHSSGLDLPEPEGHTRDDR